MLEFLDQNQPITEREIIEKLQKELKPIFFETHSTWGHGTHSQEGAEQIMQKGLYATKAPDLATTANSLENTPETMKRILNWSHHNMKFIIAIAIPKEVKSNKILWEEVGEPKQERIGRWKLPAKYIRGYVDVNNRKLVLNPLFDENPAFPKPIDNTRDAREMFGEDKSVDVPTPTDPKKDNEDVW